MAISDEYLRLLNKRSVAGEITGEKLRNLFFDFMNEIPEDLRWDFFNLFFPDCEDDKAVSSEQGRKLAAVIDLIEGEYEDDELDLTDEELGYISEGVNDFALELTDDLLMNVMKAAVSRGLMG